MVYTQGRLISNPIFFLLNSSRGGRFANLQCKICLNMDMANIFFYRVVSYYQPNKYLVLYDTTKHQLLQYSTNLGLSHSDAKRLKIVLTCCKINRI